MINRKVYFLNENYDIYPTIPSSDDERTKYLNNFEKISIKSAIQYKIDELPSKHAKSFYDLDGLIVSKMIADIFMYFDPYEMNIVPIDITFSDSIKLTYYRLDSFLSHDIIDMTESIINEYNQREEQHDFETLVLSQKKLDKIPCKELDFFVMKGMYAEQYMLSERLATALISIKDSALVIKSEADYKPIW